MHVIQIDALMPPFLFFCSAGWRRKARLCWMEIRYASFFFYNSYAHFNVHEEVDIWYGFAQFSTTSGGVGCVESMQVNSAVAMRRGVTWLLLPTEVSYNTSARIRTSWLYGSPRRPLLIMLHTLRHWGRQRVLLLHLNTLSTQGIRKSVQRLRHCAPNNLIIVLNLDGVCLSA